MRVSVFLKRVAAARAAVTQEICGNRGGMTANGLSNEGYAGGYLQALDDVDAMLRHGFPSDPRRYWSKEPTP